VTSLPAMKPKEVLAILQRAGFVIDHQSGSHVILYKEGQLPVTVPRHNRDLKRGTLHQILHTAGLTVDEFLKLR